MPLIKKILFSFIVFVVFFLILEFSIRLIFSVSLGKEQLEIKWCQWSELVGWHPPKDGVINSLGFHNPEIKPFREKGVFRILVLGSSSVYGTDDIASSWTHNLEKLLNETTSHVKYQVINAGIPGGSSHEDVKQLLFTIELDPDLVVVYNGFNDTYAMHYSPSGYLARQPKYGIQFEIGQIRRSLLRHSFAFTVFTKAAHDLQRKIKARLKAHRQYGKTAAGLSQQAQGPVGAAPELLSLVSKNPEAPKKKTLNIWDRTYVYEIDSNKQLSDDFIRYYERNLLAIHKIVSRKSIPLVVILQPSLAYSVVSGTVSEKARKILKESTNVLSDDWIKASAVYYPACVRVIHGLKQKGVLAYDFTNIFYGIEDQAFTDAVHQPDGYPKQLIAEKVRDTLLQNKLISI